MEYLDRDQLLSDDLLTQIKAGLRTMGNKRDSLEYSRALGPTWANGKRDAKWVTT